MIAISQKCQYALRAVFELAKQPGTKPVPIGQIAEAQAIPPRFLELILNELKQAGFVQSRRGVQGGYMLTVKPEDLSVGRVIDLVDGPVEPVKCIVGGGEKCPLKGTCSFGPMWKEAGDAMSQVFAKTTFKHLLDSQPKAPVPSNFSI